MHRQEIKNREIDRVCAILRGIVPTVAYSKSQYKKCNVFENGKNCSYLIFGDFWEYKTNNWKKANKLNSIAENPSFFFLKPILAEFVENLMKIDIDLKIKKPEEGCRIGFENRLIMVEEDIKPIHLGWHEDSYGFMPGECWSIVIHYKISPQVKGGNIEFKDGIYNVRENGCIIFEEGVSHRVLPITGSGMRGSLQIFVQQ